MHTFSGSSEETIDKKLKIGLSIFHRNHWFVEVGDSIKRFCDKGWDLTMLIAEFSPENNQSMLILITMGEM